MSKIAFAGTDARSLQSALVVSQEGGEGYVVRGSPAMPEFCKRMRWPIGFLPTADKEVPAYVAAIVDALKNGRLDYVIPMPEALQVRGIVDAVEAAGFGDRIAGLRARDSFIEGDKSQFKSLCQVYGIPVAPWRIVDLSSFSSFADACLQMMRTSGGAVPKYPFFDGEGKGARIIHSPWQILSTYQRLAADYKENYRLNCGESDQTNWPVVVEGYKAGIEVTFTVFIDARGNYQMFPAAFDYAEATEQGPGPDNWITGGMGSTFPHPHGSHELQDMAAKMFIEPLIQILRDRQTLRPCILYPQGMAFFDGQGRLTELCMSECNIRVGEPEWQVLLKCLRNLTELIVAMFEGRLDQVKPVMRENQVALSIALVTGPGGPKNQKGYPRSYTKGERMAIDFGFFGKKGKPILLPSGMNYENGEFLSDGGRVAYLLGAAGVNIGQTVGSVMSELRERLLTSFRDGRVRVIPRENPEGNRLTYRSDVGQHHALAETLFHF